MLIAPDFPMSNLFLTVTFAWHLAGFDSFGVEELKAREEELKGEVVVRGLGDEPEGFCLWSAVDDGGGGSDAEREQRRRRRV